MALVSMKYVARTPDAKESYVGTMVQAQAWALANEQKAVKVFRLAGRCFLKAVYVYDETWGWSKAQCDPEETLYPEDATGQPPRRYDIRRRKLLEWRRPSPEHLTRNEFAAHYGIDSSRVDFLAKVGTLRYVISRGIRFFHKDQVVPPCKKQERKLYPWSCIYPQCTECGTTEIEHCAGGLCNTCYQRNWRADIKRRIDWAKAQGAILS